MIHIKQILMSPYFEALKGIKESLVKYQNSLKELAGMCKVDDCSEKSVFGRLCAEHYQEEIQNQQFKYGE